MQQLQNFESLKLDKLVQVKSAVRVTKSETFLKLYYSDAGIIGKWENF